MLTEQLPSAPCLVRVMQRGRSKIACWQDGHLVEVGQSLDALLRLSAAEIRVALQQAVTALDPETAQLLAPVESQEVWAAGVTYLQSQAARVKESGSDLYTRVYGADRPEIFFKSAGWRAVPHEGEVGIRRDSDWNVPEPELAVLSNSRGEVIAYTCGNDMSSRSIEGENALYLPQAKVYDRSCSIGPAAVLAWHVDPSAAEIRMRIERGGQEAFCGTAQASDMVRVPAELVQVLHSSYPLPDGAWLLTGTSIVPPQTYTSEGGDLVTIEIGGIGRLLNRLVSVPHSGATARPRL